jgi:hypothetical protein
MTSSVRLIEDEESMLQLTDMVLAEPAIRGLQTVKGEKIAEGFDSLDKPIRLMGPPSTLKRAHMEGGFWSIGLNEGRPVEPGPLRRVVPLETR